MAISKVVVVDGNNLIVQIDRGVAGRGITDVQPIEIDNVLYLEFFFTDGTTETVGPVGTIQYFGQSPIVVTGSTISLSTVPVTLGGTGATTASGARTNLAAAASATTISAGTGLSGGGDLTANRTLSIANTGVTAAAYGSASKTLTATVNAQGQLTVLADTNIAITNTQVSGLGTMSTQNANNVSITGGSVTGITDLAIADGGTGQSTAAAAITALTGTQVAGQYLRSDGTNAALSAIQAADVPTLNQNTSGTAAGLSATLAIASGGTGQTTANTSFNALAPSQTGNSGKYLTTDGSNTSWATNPLGTVTSVDVSGGTTGLTTSGGPITTSGTITLAGTLATTNGGTGLTSFTNKGVVYASSTSALTTGSSLTFDGTNLGIGTTSPANQLVVSNAGAQGVEISGSGGLIQVYNRSTGAYGTMNLLANTLFFRTGASPVINMALDVSGNLGIGTTAPSYKLTVAGTSGTAVVNLLETGVRSWGIRAGGSVTNAFDIADFTAGITRLTIDSSGNLGLGVTPSAWVSSAGAAALQIGTNGASLFGTGPTWSSSPFFYISNNAYNNAGWKYKTTNASAQYVQTDGTHAWYNAASGTAGNAITFTQAMTLDASGNLRIGLTTAAYNAERLTVYKSGNAEAAAFINEAGANNYTVAVSNRAATGDNKFMVFATETSDTTRGQIVYNRASGLTTYSTTSDYRAKDIIGPVTNSGALIDSVPVYIGKMKGATLERPMFIAHEVPAYAHTGEKDAVDADGKPVYQQMDASALIPVMWAEIQSLRKRLADAGI